MHQTLTDHAIAGYRGEPNKHLPTSPAHSAHAFGAYMHSTGRSVPRDVRMGRGHSIRGNDMRFTIGGLSTAPVFARVE